MKKIVIVCSLVSGLIIAAMMITSVVMCYKTGNYEGNMWIGYTTMILAFSLIFVGIKNYRDKYNNGIVSFGKAFRIGLYITLIASTVYVVCWLIEYYCFIPDFGDRYADHILAKLREGGASQLEIDKQTREMASFKEMYKNPFFVTLMTYAEILPVGLIVTLISSFILKRKTRVAA